MNTRRIAIFIDGGYLDATLRDEFSGVKISYAKLAENIAGEFEVREGLIVYRGDDERGRPIYIQKGIDIQLGVDLVLLNAKQQISHAAIIAGDSDLIPAINVAKNEGVLIHLYMGQRRTSCWCRQQTNAPLLRGNLLALFSGDMR